MPSRYKCREFGGILAALRLAPCSLLLALKLRFNSRCKIIAFLCEEQCALNAGIKNHRVASFFADRLDDAINFSEDRLEELFAFLQDRKFDLLLFGLEILLLFLQFFLTGLCRYFGERACINFCHKEGSFGFESFCLGFKRVHDTFTVCFQLCIGSHYFRMSFDELCRVDMAELLGLNSLERNH